MKENHKWISASEVASFAFCPEAWRLDHGLELTPGNQPALEMGVSEHHKWQEVEQQSSSLVRIAMWFLAAAVLFWITRLVMG